MDDLLAKAKGIKLLVLDVDGVLTDGLLYYTENGSESKSFSVRDGLGMKLAQAAGVELAIITGRHSMALVRRAGEMGINMLLQGVKYKSQMLGQLLERKGLSWEQVAYMGDDINDLACLTQVGLPMAPLDAASEVLATATFIASRPGGHGAVREACELIVKAKGLWEKLGGSYFTEQ